MRLQVLLPTSILMEERVTKVIAEADDGVFCLLPRHIDFVAALVPGVLTYFTGDGENQETPAERYVALDHGVLVKRGCEVDVSTLNAVQGADLGRLQALIRERFLELGENERKARTALARLEAGTLRRFQELQERLRG